VPVEGKLAREMTNIAKRFNAEQSDVEVVAVYTGNYDETKIKAQAAMQAGKPPAVALVSANFVLEFKLNDQIVPLDPFLAAEKLTKDTFLADFWPALHANATVDGKLYAIRIRTRRRCSTTTPTSSRRRASIRRSRRRIGRSSSITASS